MSDKRLNVEPQLDTKPNPELNSGGGDWREPVKRTEKGRTSQVRFQANIESTAENKAAGKHGPREQRNIYQLIYDNAIDANDPLNLLLVSGREEAGLQETISCGRVGVGVEDGYSVSMLPKDETQEDLLLGALEFERRRGHLVEELKASIDELMNTDKLRRKDVMRQHSSATERGVVRGARKEEQLEEMRRRIGVRKEQVARRQAALLHEILQYEDDLKMQEERCIQEQTAIDEATGSSKGDAKIEDQDVLNSPGLLKLMDEEVVRLCNESQRVKEEIVKNKKMIKSFTAYKEHVVKAVELWPSETAGSVEQLVARFRELLVLRFELTSKVQEALINLQAAKERNLREEQLEKEREGAVLLQLHRDRAQSDAQLLHKQEAALSALQSSSSSISTELAGAYAAVANMYRVARRYKKSLPPVPHYRQVKGNDAASTASLLLSALHHFLQDAAAAIDSVQQSQRPDSTRPTLGSE